MSKKITGSSLAIQGSFYLLLSWLCFNRSNFLWQSLYLILVIGASIFILSNLYELITGKKPFSFNYIIKIFGFSLFFIYFISYPSTLTTVVPYIIGWWAILIGVIQGINFYVYRKDMTRGAMWKFILSITSLLFGIYLLLGPLTKINLLTFIAGCWLLFTGIATWIDALQLLLSERFKHKISQYFNLSVPIVVSAIIPIQAFSSLSKLSQTQDHHVKPDVEIFIYLKNRGFEQFGHVDIAFEGKTYSYGCHDPLNRKLLGTFGDGVLFVSDRDSFLQTHLVSEDKFIISYGLQLTEKQKDIVRNKIKEMLSRSYPWQSQYEQGNHEAVDYASRVYSATQCQMYKFSKGKFRTYFVFSTNCVLLADYLLRFKELGLLNMSGIITPGNYLTFLNDEFLREGSIVTSRAIYKKLQD